MGKNLTCPTGNAIINNDNAFQSVNGKHAEVPAMLLYVLILNKTECMPRLVASLMRAGIKGGTVYDSMGFVQYVGHDMTEPPPIFGSLRKYLHPDGGNNKTMLLLLEKEQLAAVKAVVNETTGGLSKPDVGIAFVVPVSEAEGIL